MIIKRLEKVDVHGYDYGESSEFEDYEIKKVEATNAQKAWYWYKTGSYEGSGCLILLKDNKYYLHDCGHCSCYGPTENISLTNGFEDLDSLLASCSEGYQKKEVQPLVDFIKAKD